MKRLLFSVTVLVSLVGCGDKEDVLKNGNDWDIVIPASKQSPGIGDSDELPSGTVWTPPTGISVVSRPDQAFNPDLQLLFGNLNTFYADLNLVNSLDKGITVDIPAGLIFVFNEEGRTQNGILTAPVSVVVPPTQGQGAGEPADTTTVYIGLGCLNYSKAFPWEENQEWDTRDYPIGKDMYSPSVVTGDPNLKKLIDILKDYPELRLKRHFNPQDGFLPDYVMPDWLKIYDRIQQALWTITDGNGLTRKEYNELVTALKPYK